MTNQTIESIQGEEQCYAQPSWSSKALVPSREDYEVLYRRSIADPAGFWGDIGSEFYWYKPWEKVCEYDFNNEIDIKFFAGGKTNVCVNALDRHVEAGDGDKIAYYWEGNSPDERRVVTYRYLLHEVGKLANGLRSLGVSKGTVVTIYMPMVPELAIAMLACARIGAVHSVVFGGFSADAIKGRLLDAQSHFLITANVTKRGRKEIPLKQIVDEAMAEVEAAGHSVTSCIVYRKTDDDVNMKPGRDLWWHDLIADSSPECPPAIMDAEDPLFILYTSGSTGKPKGVLHTTGGYMVYATTTFRYVFDYQTGDIFWCTADIGWITGHSYIVYGPLCAGATSVMFDGVPTYPDAGRFWEICSRYRVSQFYTAPTAIRALMREGESWPAKYDLSALRILGSVGEPINPEAWRWYHKNIGAGNCPIVDTWWQTETGGIMIAPLPGAFPLKPGSATVPFFGVSAKVVREDGSECAPNEGGLLVLTAPWPGMMRTVYGAHSRFKETYFSRFPGWYFTGDGARVDQDGYFWLMGRVDDVINVSGHRIGTAEVESALVLHQSVAEAAVVGFPHEIKGQGLYAFVTLKGGVAESEQMKKNLAAHVRETIGPIATPDRIQFTDSLPKTRSGKIMRRILRKIAAGEVDSLGDITTLSDPQVVDRLVQGRTS